MSDVGFDGVENFALTSSATALRTMGVTGVGGSSVTIGGPSLILNFVEGTTLDPRITFTRGSNATVTGANGLIQYAPANLLTYSSDFTQAAWTKSNASVSGTYTAPDGTATAQKLVEDTSTTTHQLFLTSAVTVSAGTYSASFYVKAAGRSILRVSDNSNGTTTNAFFSLSGAGSVTSETPAGTGSISDAGGGWYRCTMKTVTVAAAVNPLIRLVDAGTNTVYTGDGTSGIYIWGAQLSPVTAVQAIPAYVATTTAAYYGARFDYDATTLAANGLLIEEQRTNLLTYSQDFTQAAWTKTNVSASGTYTAPDGTATASVIIPNTANDLHYVFEPSPTVAGINTCSVYMKPAGYSWVGIFCNSSANAVAWFNVTTGVIGTVSGSAATKTASIAAVGGGWYRCTLTASASSGSSAGVVVGNADNSGPFAGDGTSGIYIWGAQLEAGAFATSYIPTTTATATRAADSATMAGANFSSWYNASAGTVVWDGVIGSNKIEDLVSFTAATIAESFTLYKTGVPDIRQWMRTGGVTQYNITLGSITLAASTKIAAAYALNNSSGSLNGQTAVVSATGTPSAPTQLWLAAGASNIGGPASQFWLKRLTYYPTRLADATLKALTA